MLLRDSLMGRLHFSCAALASDRYEDAGSLVLDNLQRLLNWSHPWYQRDAAVARKERVGQLKNAWEEAYGPMNDPATVAKINAAVAELDARKRGPADPDAARLRLFYERLGQEQSDRLGRRRSA